MSRRPVVIVGPDKGAADADARLLALASLAMVRGYDPVVVAEDIDAATYVGWCGGEFWAIESPPPEVYTVEVAAAFAAWEAQIEPADVLRLRRSRPWDRWLAEIQSELSNQETAHADRI